MGKTALLLVWDERAQRRAPWHTSSKAREWISRHNRKVKEEGKGVRILAVPAAEEEPVAQPHRAQVGRRQAEGSRA